LSCLNGQVTVDALPRIIDIMGEELGWDGKRKEKEFDDAIVFLRSMGLPEVCKPPEPTFEIILSSKSKIQVPRAKNQIQNTRKLKLTNQGTNLSLADMRRAGPKTLLGLKPETAKLYERAQFTPDEVNNLRAQFAELDFVSNALHSSRCTILTPLSTTSTPNPNFALAPARPSLISRTTISVSPEPT
jgi:glycerol-3-phosphate dehydrogenase